MKFSWPFGKPKPAYIPSTNFADELFKMLPASEILKHKKEAHENATVKECEYLVGGLYGGKMYVKIVFDGRLP